MKPHCVPVLLLLLVLLLVCTTQTWEASPLSQRHARTSPHSAPHERDAPLTSGFPPFLDNSTNPLCLFLPLPDIGRAYSEECGIALAELDSSHMWSEEEKRALEEVCTPDCMGKVVHFLSEDCGDVVVANSLVALCAELEGTPCHHITNSYNWTALETACDILSGEKVSGECSEKCSEAVWSATEVIGCCSNYDHILSLFVTDCGVNMPDHCLDPFKDEKEEKEKEEEEEDTKTLDEDEKNKGKDDESNDEGQLSDVQTESSGSILRPYYIGVLLVSLLSVCPVFS